MRHGRKSTLKGLATYVKEHFPNAAYGVYPIEDDTKIAIIVVANKYSPNNFWYRFLPPTWLRPRLANRTLSLFQERTMALTLHI